jgi:hypothetical protein
LNKSTNICVKASAPAHKAPARRSISYLITL